MLAALDGQADLVERHLWLVRLFDWIRGDGTSVPAVVARVAQWLDALDADPAAKSRAMAWWQTLLVTVDGTTLLADFGFTSRSAFASEFAERLRLKIMPGTPETIDASELFSLALPNAFDAVWLAALIPQESQEGKEGPEKPENPLLARLAALLGGEVQAERGVSLWQHTLLEAITFCAGQIRASGFSPELRLRMSAAANEAEPFHALSTDFDLVRTAFVAAQREGLRARPADDGLQEPLADALADPLASTLANAVEQFRARLDQCRQGASTVYSHLDEHGISVNVVFRLRQLRERVLRIRALMDCLVGAKTSASTTWLLSHLVTIGRERRSLRALVASNSSLLATKVTERSSETGEHYITRTRAQYRDMLRRAAGGGALTALTTLLKFGVMAVGLSQFWNGFWSGFVYAASFVAIQLLHWTLATKQPAMTAPAMAAKLKNLEPPGALDVFVDEVAHLVRSQVAAVLGNVGVVVPAVVLLSLLAQFAFQAPMIDATQAQYVLESLSLAGPTLFFAAFTGILLFASSLVAGWVENWFVMHRLQSALRYNPRITAFLGTARAARWAQFMREKISGFASNISLGFMLGLIPAFAAFFGLGLEVRHVTLSAGQLAAASAALGWQVLQQPAFWWCAAAIPLIGAANLGVSFYLAFRLALSAHNVGGVDAARIGRAVRSRWRTRPLDFFLPTKEALAEGPDKEAEKPIAKDNDQNR